ncbi:LPXTG cell wall anchor domain-containing protein [Rathayibacter festucae]|uniref:DUF7507 domain-containing protein n=1 Tax=Rathayibacter festucae TaxID=110937 RepID=UPI001FB2BB8F|nr:LPXTG cell wall anchor domain-containing protein [Rathayibacter festucae]MCJ1701735.1 LPXTG cell wall anchor domain-containing protein [Rathayibacter festucae]
MTPRRPDVQGPRRSLGAPLSIAASLTLSACLLGSTALVAHADEAAVPVVSETAAPAAAPPTTAPATSAPDAAPAAAAVAPAPAAPAPVAAAPAAPATAAPAPAAPTPVAAAPAAAATPSAPAPIPTATPAPDAPAPTAPAAPASAPEASPAAATPTPAPSQQPAPTVDKPNPDAQVTATAKGTLDLKAGEKVAVGTKVNWVVTVHNPSTFYAYVGDSSIELSPGQSADITVPTPTTITLSDLDAGVATYSGDFFVSTFRTPYTVTARGDVHFKLDASTTVPTPSAAPATSAAPTSAPTPSASPVPSPATSGAPATAEHPRLEASITGTLVLKPGETVAVGTKIDWTTTVKNTGDVDFGGPGFPEKSSIAAGQTKVYHAVDTVTQEDLDAGVVRREGSATGLRVGRAPTVSAPFIGIIALPAQIAALTGTPSPEPTPPPAGPTASPTPAAATDRVTATVRGVPDLKPGEKPTVGTTVKWIVTFLHHTPDTVKIGGTTLELTPGRSGYVEDTTKPSTITQADLDAGVVRYESEFGVDTPEGRYTIPARGELTLPTPAPAPAAAEHPSLTGRIAGEFVLPADGRVRAGTPVKWTATLTNAGDVALSDVHVTDAGEHTTLAVGETKDLTFYSTVTREDVAEGFTFDTFHASGRTPAGSTASLELNDSLDLHSDEGRVAVITTGAFELAAGEQVKAGTRVSWTVTVTNTAGTDLHDLSADGDARSETIAVLTPGETRQLHLETTVTAQDLAGDRTRLVADLVGRTGDSPFSASASGELAIGTEHPRLEVSATGAFDLEPGHSVTVGTKIVWTVTAKNTGDVSFLALDEKGPGSLAAGETKVYRVADAVTQEDLDAGVVRRVSTAKGFREGRPTYVSAPYLGVLAIPAATGGATTDGGTGTATTAVPTTAPSVTDAESTVDDGAPAGPVIVGHRAGAAARPDAAAASASTDAASAPTGAASASTVAGATRSGTRSASAAHLAQTGVDASSALPAAGVLGLLGALGMLLGARRRRNRTAD